MSYFDDMEELRHLYFFHDGLPFGVYDDTQDHAHVEFQEPPKMKTPTPTPTSPKPEVRASRKQEARAPRRERPETPTPLPLQERIAAALTPSEWDWLEKIANRKKR